MLHRCAGRVLLTILMITANPAVAQMSVRLVPDRPVFLQDLTGGGVSGGSPSLTDRSSLLAAPRNHRVRNAVIGGLIGAATGVITCTVISNLANDPGTGTSTCDTKAYVGFALGGAALGALVGALFK